MSEYTKNIWVGIEVTRQMRLLNGELAPAGALEVAGVNLLDHQIRRAKEITSPDQICVLHAQADATLLELIAQHEVRELAPFDFIAMLNDRVKQEEEGAVALLRQIAPLRDSKAISKAVKMLKKHPVVVSASKPPKGHKRHDPLPDQDQPDYRCLAFEVRRMSQFNMQAMSGLGVGDEELLYIDWEDFAEYATPGDETEAAATLKSWL